jgi:hypothetical protein
VPEQRPYWERMVFGTGHGFRAEREEKVLRYINHRIDADVALRDVLQEPYVRRNCSQDEIEEILRKPRTSSPLQGAPGACVRLGGARSKTAPLGAS